MNKIRSNLNEKTLTQQVVSYLETYIGDEMILSSFIRDLIVFFASDEELHIGIKTPFGKKLIEGEYKDAFIAASREIFNKPLVPVFFIQGEYNIPNTVYKRNIELSVRLQSTEDAFLNQNFTFDNYVVASFNKQASDACHTILQEKGKYNPLFIFSGSGFGKTHLLHALGNKALGHNKSVFYITADRFTKEVKRAIDGGSEEIEKLKENYKSADYLLIDDVQLLANRTKTLDILFDIFNSAIEKGSQQIVLTSDKTPNELVSFEDRFVTRFGSGLVLEIKRPDPTDFEKIVRIKINNKPKIACRKWDDEAIIFLARNNSTSIRGVESNISRIEFYLETYPEDIKVTIGLLNQVFKDVFIDEQNITPDRVLDVICRYYKVKKQELIGKSREQKFVVPRHMGMYLMKNINKLPYKKIGEFFSNRDHSTVISAIDNIEHKKKVNLSVSAALSIIEGEIRKMS